MKKKVKFIIHKLEELYPKPAIPLKHEDPYTLLIAVLLSAQCTDKKVNEVTPPLFKKADTPQKMVMLSIKEIKNIIKPCGLFENKSKAIYNLSRKLIDEYGGKVPKTFEDLESLPGVGHKTASVVMVQAFGQPAFPVDTHIHRLMCRWKLSNGKNVVQTEKDCKRIFPKALWANLHLQIIYFGREYCQARGHNIALCPICKQLNVNTTN